MANPMSFFQSLKGGGPAPAVDPENLKRVWKFFESLRAEVASRNSEENRSSGPSPLGVEADILAQQCSPGANIGAVTFRCQCLQMFSKEGLLAPWQHGEELEDIVFEVFAAYPVHIGKFDSEALLKDLREKSNR